MLSSNTPTVLSNSDSSIQDEDSISLGNIFHIFWLHRRLFFVVVIFVCIAGSTVVFQLIPRYTADTKVLVGAPKSQVVDVEAVLSGDVTNASGVQSEAEVLLSRGLAKKVITKLGLLNLVEFNPSLAKKEDGFFSALSPKNWLSDDMKETLGLMKIQEMLTDEEKQDQVMATATDIYVSKLKVAPIRGSQVIGITFESLDAKLVAKLANTHADSYIIGQLEAKFEATEKASSWLNNQLSDLRAKVASSEKAVEYYRVDHGLVHGANKETGLAGEQLSEINSQLIIAKAQKAEASARLAQVTRLLNNGAEIETASEVLSSALIQNLRGQETELARKLSEMSAEMGAKHPKLISVNAEITELKGKIKAEISKIAAGLRNEMNIASAREASLQGSVSASRSTSGDHGKEEVQLHALEREANSNKLLFETFLNRFKETSSSKGMEEADARVISVAEVPSIASFPKKNTLFAVVILLALGLASALVFLLEALHPGLRTPKEIEDYLGYPAIGLIPKTNKKIAPYDYLIDKPNSSVGEAVSALRISLTLSNPDKPVKSLVVTSSIPGEGKSLLVLLLARSAAIAGQKVIVVDTDFRRPTIEKKLGLSTTAQGLTDLIMSHDNNISEFMYKDEKSNLMIMPKGNGEYINPVDMFASQRMSNLLAELHNKFDLIIFDTPPVLAVSDARVLSALVDKTIFVVAWDTTPRKVVKSGLEQLLRSQSNLAGIVLQQVDLKQYGSNSYSYGGSGAYYQYSKYGEYYSN
ncbi:MAG: polysaccharide biosynthesis tyrosine autokinase [Gammaproteobacteria bacterium]|nr:polysaccharide biosynthesis tyrosine autokinase [Gammaproteobacteria bacterium]